MLCSVKEDCELMSASDPLPWLFLGKKPEICQNATFVDVDYPQLMQKKVSIIEQTPQLNGLLPDFMKLGNENGLLATSTKYLAIGCDLRNLELLKLVLQARLDIENASTMILFVAEVSIAYMEKKASQAVLEWATGYEDVRFCLLEQHLPDGPDHPFAATMLAHFEKLRTPLRAIGTMAQMEERFVGAGWPLLGVDIRTLWDLWSDQSYVTAEERRALDKVEPFDEWEEFALFGSHYFLLVAKKPAAPGDANGFGNDEDPELADLRANGLIAGSLPGTHSHRRFAALLPCQADKKSLGLHAGLGTKERLTGTNVYSTTDTAIAINGPSLRSGLMCHTITQFGTKGDCLLVGGRTSPDKASAECWLRKDDCWLRTQTLLKGRFRHSAVAVGGGAVQDGVIVMGGKTSDGEVLGDWLLWTESKGWRALKTTGERPPVRFGAAIVAQSVTDGMIYGGMDESGVVLSDCWSWQWDGADDLQCQDKTGIIKSRLGRYAGALGRFGAQAMNTENGRLLIGGVAGKGMLTRDDEILNLSDFRPLPIQGPRPLLVGFSALSIEEGYNKLSTEGGALLVMGGGATCFSFGTHWNADCMLIKPDYLRQDEEAGWRLVDISKLESPPKARDVSQQELADDETSDKTYMPLSVAIPRSKLGRSQKVARTFEAGKPVIFEDCNIGPCRERWSSDYLKAKLGSDRQVVVHSSGSQHMDFQTKNFRYVPQTFGHFIDAVERGGMLYLRALSKDAPSDKPTNLAEDFPEIACDFRLPPELRTVVADAHSSPLRISGPVTMWLHYDVMANVLCQVRGRKKLLLFPPSDVRHLGFGAGASSSSIDVFNPDLTVHPSLAQTNPHEAILESGDILYIPPLWLHTAAPTDGMSVAVNVFFRSLQSGYAAGRDVYGNRDLAAYEKGRKDVAKIAKTFEDLPPDVSQFYLERLGMELLEKARSS